jgi:N-acetyl-anhydromuramyl-L-alanine amidase AmpD
MGISQEETKLGKIDGVQVYSRKDDAGQPAVLDAIDLDKSKIEAITEKLSRRGYGVMRQTKARAGKVRYLFQAKWAGDGQPPDEPLEGL